MAEPKLWSERDFDECCFAVSGVGNETMVCAEPCRGSYCKLHRGQMVMEIAEAEQLRRDRERLRARRAHLRRELRAAAALAAAQPKSPPPPSLQAIIADVAARHRVSVEELRGPSRHRYLIIPRQEFFYEAHRHGKSYPQAAAFCGGRDHTTALHGKRRHEARLSA